MANRLHRILLAAGHSRHRIGNQEMNYGSLMNLVRSRANRLRGALTAVTSYALSTLKLGTTWIQRVRCAARLNRFVNSKNICQWDAAAS